MDRDYLHVGHLVVHVCAHVIIANNYVNCSLTLLLGLHTSLQYMAHVSEHIWFVTSRFSTWNASLCSNDWPQSEQTLTSEMWRQLHHMKIQNVSCTCIHFIVSDIINKMWLNCLCPSCCTVSATSLTTCQLNPCFNMFNGRPVLIARY